MKVEKIEEKHLPNLLKFCDECKLLGYVNNENLDNMRYYWCKQIGGNFLGIFHNNEIISIAGYHPLPEINNTAQRIFFRSCTLNKKLPDQYKTLHKGTNFKTRIYIREFIRYCGTDNMYVTTNIQNNKYDNITRYHQSMLLESKQKDSYISYIDTIHLYQVDQAIWKIDGNKFIEKYGKD